MNAFLSQFFLKAIISLPFWLIYCNGFSQFTDDFSDLDFTNDPTWSGTESLWQINNGQLQSNSSTANTFYLSTPSTVSFNAEWKFYLNLKFGTSGANYTDIFLLSDDKNLNSAQNAYFIRVGDTKDEIAFYKIKNGSIKLLLQSPPGIVNSSSGNPFSIKIIRDNLGLWTLNYDDGNTGSFTEAGTVFDNEVATSSHFGILVEQSSAIGARKNHYFDNITVTDLSVDEAPPQLLGLNVISDTELMLNFNEPIDQNQAEKVIFYSVSNGIASPVSAQLDPINKTDVKLLFSTPFQDGTTYQLSISNLTDLKGNEIVAVTTPFLYYQEKLSMAKDIIFNEVFPDYSPSNGLPEAEYIELFNNSDKILNLKNWSFSDPVKSANLDQFILTPGNFLILCASDNELLLAPYGDVMGMENWPDLNNGGDILVIKNAEGDLIDSVSYDDSWYNSSTKSQGGWALELIDPSNTCSGENNWAAAEVPVGGTPGTKNSVKSSKPDLLGPEIVEAFGLKADSVVLKFNEKLDPGSVNMDNFQIDNGTTVTSVRVSGELSTVSLLVNPMLQPGIKYTLTAGHLTDCSGNRITKKKVISFSLVQKAGEADLIINEILFNPRAGGVDFVEIYNKSSKYINLNGWMLANDTESRLITDKNLVIPPERYLAFTMDGVILKEQYPLGKEDRFFEIPSFPAYASEAGKVALLQPDSATMDMFEYSEDLHFPLLSTHDGISLERISLVDATNKIDNWKSAASSAGFATPGYANSQAIDKLPSNTGEIIIAPKIIVPDGSGQNDFATIRYSFKQPGYVANVQIMDIYGRTIKRIAQNDYLSASGFYTWDGFTENGTKARFGYYLVYFEVFNLDGIVKKFKEKVVVGTKF